MIGKNLSPRTLAGVTALALALLLGQGKVAEAGCGCDKPPPLPASVRPHVTYGGQKVTLFHPSLVNGGSYTVKFTAMNGTSASITGTAVNRRDLADAVYKNQLMVNVPTSLPFGPVGITVTQAGQTTPFLSVSDASFTLAPQPVVVPNQVGSYNYQNYQAAIGRDGRAYLSLDITGMTMPRTFKAQAKGWPLRFTKDNTVFYNVQGFLMQLATAPIPGLFSIASGIATDSDIAQYARHEFNTYLLQHAEHLPHSVDSADGNWHVDGTRHIDHDRLILAIVGTVNGATPAAGATPAFTLTLDVYSFFENGLVGLGSATMSSSSTTDSYNHLTNLSGTQGDVLSNGTVSLSTASTVNGNATGATFVVDQTSRITGQRLPAQPVQFIPVQVPTGLIDLGSINLSRGANLTLGPGSYKASQLTVDNSSQLFVNNTTGPVTIYVTGAVSIGNQGQLKKTASAELTGVTSSRVVIAVADSDPEKFALYVAGTSPVQITAGGSFYGVVYAPQTSLSLYGSSDYFGAFVTNSISLSGNARVHYDTALRGE